MHQTNQIIAYETGELSEANTIKLFQGLINTGQAWQLPGAYGRMAQTLINQGLCTLGDNGYYDAYGNYVPSKHEVEPGTRGSAEYLVEK